MPRGAAPGMVPVHTALESIVKIACLHTAESNIAVFETAAKDVGLAEGTLVHAVRPDLLAEAEKAGGPTQAIARETASVLKALSENADAVILTCSTLGPSVDALAGTMPILRADAALARQAAAIGGRIVVLCAVETTLEPTTLLFEEEAGASCEVRLVPGAWARFKSGDRDGYLSAISEAVEAAYRDGASIVALAQASMAGAAALVRNGPKPLASPAAALTVAARLVSQNA